MLEREIEEAVCRWAKATYGFIPYKFTSPNRRSVPDRLFIGHGGHSFFIEFKSASGNLTSAQGREIKRLTERGQRVYVVNSVKLGKQVVLYEVQEHAPWVSGEGNRLHPAPPAKHAMAGHGPGQDSGQLDGNS